MSFLGEAVDWYEENVSNPVGEWEKILFGADEQKQLDQSAVPTTNNQTSVVPVAVRPPAQSPTSTWTKVGVVAGVLALVVGAYAVYKG